MGTITGTAIINAAAYTLQDATNKRWTRAELLGYLNDGQRDLCLIKPEAYTINASQQLVAGVRQSIPATGAAFVAMRYNLGTTGSTIGRTPRVTDLEVMGRNVPKWAAASASAEVQEVMHDPKDPKVFYVSPPQPASNQGYAQVVYHGVPTDLGAEASTIVLDDVYKTALVNYVIYRAYLKEGEFINPAGAMAHRAEFLGLLGAKDTSEAKAKAGD